MGLAIILGGVAFTSFFAGIGGVLLMIKEIPIAIPLTLIGVGTVGMMAVLAIGTFMYTSKDLTPKPEIERYAYWLRILFFVTLPIMALSSFAQIPYMLETEGRMSFTDFISQPNQPPFITANPKVDTLDADVDKLIEAFQVESDKLIEDAGSDLEKLEAAQKQIQVLDEQLQVDVGKLINESMKIDELVFSDFSGSSFNHMGTASGEEAGSAVIFMQVMGLFTWLFAIINTYIFAHFMIAVLNEINEASVAKLYRISTRIIIYVYICYITVLLVSLYGSLSNIPQLYPDSLLMTIFSSLIGLCMLLYFMPFIISWVMVVSAWTKYNKQATQNALQQAINT